jgi:hypothetical protein
MYLPMDDIVLIVVDPAAADETSVLLPPEKS